MDRSFTQLTPVNAEQLLLTLQRLAASGPVSVAQQNLVGGHPFYGRLTFGFGQIRHTQILEARAAGLVMSTPVMPEGFVPRQEGDAVAYYRVEDKVVTIRYWMAGLISLGYRVFQFS